MNRVGGAEQAVAELPIELLHARELRGGAARYQRHAASG